MVAIAPPRRLRRRTTAANPGATTRAGPRQTSGRSAVRDSAPWPRAGGVRACARSPGRWRTLAPAADRACAGRGEQGRPYPATASRPIQGGGGDLAHPVGVSDKDARERVGVAVQVLGRRVGDQRRRRAPAVGTPEEWPRCYRPASAARCPLAIRPSAGRSATSIWGLAIVSTYRSADAVQRVRDGVQVGDVAERRIAAAAQQRVGLAVQLARRDHAGAGRRQQVECGHDRRHPGGKAVGRLGALELGHRGGQLVAVGVADAAVEVAAARVGHHLGEVRPPWRTPSSPPGAPG